MEWADDRILLIGIQPQLADEIQTVRGIRLSKLFLPQDENFNSGGAPANRAVASDESVCYPFNSILQTSSACGAQPTTPAIPAPLTHSEREAAFCSRKPAFFNAQPRVYGKILTGPNS